VRYGQVRLARSQGLELAGSAAHTPSATTSATRISGTFRPTERRRGRCLLNSRNAPPWQARPGKDLRIPNTPCPHCGHCITLEERTHVDAEHLECPQGHQRFIPGGEKLISTS